MATSVQNIFKPGLEPGTSRVSSERDSQLHHLNLYFTDIWNIYILYDEKKTDISMNKPVTAEKCLKLKSQVETTTEPQVSSWR